MDSDRMVSGHFEEHEEEYMETFYEFYEQRGDAVVRNGELAAALNISPASATEMIQRLSRKGYLSYEPYKGARMTPTGLSLGRKMKRRHRLVEVLLHDVLQFQGDIHAAACRLEHAIDDELEWTLDELLGRPENDPSGRPIPPPESRNAPFPKQALIRASSLGAGQSGTISVIVIEPENRTDLRNLGIVAGATISKSGSEWCIDDLEYSIDESILNRVLVSINSE